MKKNLGLLIASGLDLNLLWSITISDYDISAMGYYSKKTENYLIANGFERKFHTYKEDDKDYKHFQHPDGIRIILTGKVK